MRTKKMTKNNENIVFILKGIVDRNGPSYLSDEPYEVYKELIADESVDRKIAAAILHFLVNGLLEEAKRLDEEQMSEKIQRECSLNKKMANKLADTMSSLCSDDNRKRWKDMECEGLRSFLQEMFICEWKGVCCMGCRQWNCRLSL